MGEEIVNKVESEAEPAHISEDRPAMKLDYRTAPRLIICVPIGDKDDPVTTDCPHCEKRIEGRPIRRARGLVPIHWATNSFQLVNPLDVAIMRMFEFGRLAAESREVLTHNALKYNPKYIFYQDDDVILPPLGLYDLYNFMECTPEVGAVTGVYCTKEVRTEPIIYKRHGDGAYWGFQAGEGAEPEQIFSTGGGCLLVRADAIRKMEPPYWADSQKGDTGHHIVWGHDVRFCRKLQEEAGMPLYMMGSVLCGHYDTDTGIEYRLPSNSPPMKLWRHVHARDYWEDVWGSLRVTDAPRPETYDWMLAQFGASGPGIAGYADLGCGTGVLLQKVAMQLGHVGVGYDFSDQALAFAKQLYLPVQELDVKNLTEDHLAGCSHVTASFLLEWLDVATRERLVKTCAEVGSKLIVTVERGIGNTKDKITKARLEKLLSKYYPNVHVEVIQKKFLGGVGEF